MMTPDTRVAYYLNIIALDTILLTKDIWPDRLAALYVGAFVIFAIINLFRLK